MSSNRRKPASQKPGAKKTATKPAAQGRKAGSAPGASAKGASAGKVTTGRRGASARAATPKRSSGLPAEAKSYSHPGASQVVRPDVGLQSTFKRKKEPKTYRFDSSLSPALDWDTAPARETAEALIRQIQEAPSIEAAKAAAAELARLGRPFLDWTGKAERLSFEVPTLPLFVHERLSTKAIIASLRGHQRDQLADGQVGLDLFGDEKLSIRDRQLRAYEHRGGWVNRLILGDSAVVMNSLLEFEGMKESVQMIYMDPPYGVKFGSNFQPFVRKRDVKHNDDADLTREPEMVQAYRDTWELGVHSYLTYLRDRLLIARDLLAPSGSIFVQISDDNLHHVREVLEEVFGHENFVALIPFKKTGGASSATIPSVVDYLVWFARDAARLKYTRLFTRKVPGEEGATNYSWVELPDGSRRPLTSREKEDWRIPAGAKVFQPYPMFSEGPSANDRPFEWNGETYRPSANSHWKTTAAGLQRLAALNRLVAQGKTLRFVNYLDDYPVTPLTNIWTDTQISGFAEERLYVVQTLPKVIQRCVLMTTDPGDLVLDPTCGGGTTPYVAEQWGRRWIAIDTSRVPLALTRQRLLTATFPWYELRNEAAGPAAGFRYIRKRSAQGEEVGGLVPHVTMGSVANNESPKEEVLVDRPEVVASITRVAGALCVEATIPTPVDLDGDGVDDAGAASAKEHAAFADRLLEVLRHAGNLYVPGGAQVQLHSIRPPAKSLALAAEAWVDATAPGQHPTLMDAADEAEAQRGDRLDLAKAPVALVFGPEHGAVSEKLVYNAAREASAKRYTHLYVLGFAIEPQARQYVEDCESLHGIPATYVQMTPDLIVGDLLKTTKASQIFSVVGQPDVRVTRTSKKGEDERFTVELRGLDIFDPATLESRSQAGESVPMWMLDTDYDDMAFHAAQVFFPRTAAWDALKKALRATHDESVWEHLKGTTSAPFEPGPNRKVAVKVIDDRGNELLVVKALDEPR